MSTYLVAYAVTDFESRSEGNVSSLTNQKKMRRRQKEKKILYFQIKEDLIHKQLAKFSHHLNTATTFERRIRIYRKLALIIIIIKPLRGDHLVVELSEISVVAGITSSSQLFFVNLREWLKYCEMLQTILCVTILFVQSKSYSLASLCELCLFI